MKTVSTKKCLGALYACFVLLHNTVAQSPVTFYNIHNNSSLPYTQQNAPGWNSNNPFTSGNQFILHYAQSASNAGGFEREIVGFNIGSRSFSRQTGMNGTPFDRVLVNRHPRLQGDTINAFYEFTASSSNHLFFAPSYVPTLEALINSYVCNRGSDNLFSNTPTTRSNIERVDLIQTAGIQVLNASSQGFLINERGGNDNFKVAVITALNTEGRPSALGTLIQVTASHWGRVGPSIQTRVMSRRLSTDATLRPKEDIPAQTISGVYISFSDLGISNGSQVYGLSIFPNDVAPAMDLIGLSNVPTNTNQTDGGLDMIAGMGYFTENFILPQNNSFDFEAIYRNGAVQLRWAPAPGLAFSKAEVQRMEQGAAFSTIATLLPGTLHAAGAYTFTDVLAGVRMQTVSYRLRLFDLKGNVYYSPVRSVALQKSGAFEWQQFSTVFTTHLQLQWHSSASGVMEIALLSIDGILQRRLRHVFSAGSGQLQLHVPPHLSAGTYLLRVVQNGKMETKRVVKL